MNQKILQLSAVSFVCAATAVSAQDYSVGFGIATFGATVEATYSIKPGLDVRGIAFVPLKSSTDEVELNEYYTLNGEDSNGAFAVVADYYPAGHGWRLSGGLFFAPETLLTGTFAGPIPFSGRLGTDKSVAPILAGGYKHNFDNGWYASGELGAIFSNFVVSSDNTNRRVVAVIAEMNKDLDDRLAYPYLSVTVGFRF